MDDATPDWVKKKLRKKFLVVTRLYEKDGGHCSYCKIKFPLLTTFEDYDQLSIKIKPTIDHRIPPWRGGSRKSIKNFVLACNRCNSLKGSLTEEEFRFYLETKPEVIKRLRRYIENIQQKRQPIPNLIQNYPFDNMLFKPSKRQRRRFLRTAARQPFCFAFHPITNLL